MTTIRICVDRSVNESCTIEIDEDELRGYIELEDFDVDEMIETIAHDSGQWFVDSVEWNWWPRNKDDAKLYEEIIDGSA